MAFKALNKPTAAAPAPKPARTKEIDEAFSERPDLADRVFQAFGNNPKQAELHTLFSDIGSFICELKRRNPNSSSSENDSEPANKKRKIEDEAKQQLQVPTRTAISAATNANGTKSAANAWSNVSIQPAWKAQDVSFSIPQRKKLHMEIIKDGPKGASGGIRGVNTTSGAVEFGVSWKDVEQIFCLPIPEKAKKQHNFVLIPKNGDGVNPPPEGVTAPEPIVWTFVEATGKEIKEGVDPGPTATANAINEHLLVYGKKVIFPDEKQFASVIPEAHRKGEKAFHVKAYRGSKDGYLFFTSVGILFGYKKPLAYFSFDSISSISYTSVLQRTFNLAISVQSSPLLAPKDQEIEFAMLDQENYTGIDEYIKRHGLNDASMAAARKAKKLNINGPAKGEQAQAEGGEDEEGELEKAQRMLEDEEDEEDDDFEPPDEDDEGSDGSGSGSDEDSEDDEDEDEEDEDEDDQSRNIVAEELGSEAEEVEMSD